MSGHNFSASWNSELYNCRQAVAMMDLHTSCAIHQNFDWNKFDSAKKSLTLQEKKESHGIVTLSISALSRSEAVCEDFPSFLAGICMITALETLENTSIRKQQSTEVFVFLFFFRRGPSHP